MILESLISSALGFIVGGIKNSKGGQTAFDDLSTGIWNWIKPIFFEEDEDMVRNIEEQPDNPENQLLIKHELKKKINKDAEFKVKLEKMIENALDKGEKPASLNINQIHYGTGDNVGGDKTVNISGKKN